MSEPITGLEGRNLTTRELPRANGMTNSGNARGDRKHRRSSQKRGSKLRTIIQMRYSRGLHFPSGAVLYRQERSAGNPRRDMSITT